MEAGFFCSGRVQGATTVDCIALRFGLSDCESERKRLGSLDWRSKSGNTHETSGAHYTFTILKATTRACLLRRKPQVEHTRQSHCGSHWVIEHATGLACPSI